MRLSAWKISRRRGPIFFTQIRAPVDRVERIVNILSLTQAAVLVAAFLAVADELGVGAATREIDKPLLAAALASAGLEPTSRAWAVRVARDPRGGPGAALVWAADARRDARCVFSHTFCKSQRLRVKAPDEPPPPESRLVHVKTAFAAPPGLRARRGGLDDVAWFPARLLAFANGAPTLRCHLLGAEGARKAPTPRPTLSQ